MTRNLLFRACAIWLLLLAASPVTLPCLTYDLAAPVHDSTPAADGSKLKSALQTFAAIPSALPGIAPAGITWVPRSAAATSSTMPRLISPVLRI